MRTQRRQQVKIVNRARQKPLILTIYNSDQRPRDLSNDTITLSLFRLWAGDQGYDLNYPIQTRDVGSLDVVVQQATTTLLAQSGATLGQLEWDPMDDGQEHDHVFGSLNLAPGDYAMQLHITDANGDTTDYPEDEPGILVLRIRPTFRLLADE